MSDGLNKPAAPKARQLPLWLVALHPRVLRVRVGDWFWLRRARAASFDPGESVADYVVRKRVQEIDALDRLESVREAHEWGCDCISHDPCRIAIALDGGPGAPSYVVELGGQRFTQAQWEAVQIYIEGPPCTCPDPEIAARSGHVSKCGTTL